MGSVWVAHHAGLEIDVAVKFLLPELQTVEGALRRFSEEAMVAAQIKSPHVVQVLDHGALSDELPFIVMELLDGKIRREREYFDRLAMLEQLGVAGASNQG
jgi:serine/threonine-protein kinase